MKTDYLSSTMALMDALGKQETQDLQRQALRQQMEQERQQSPLQLDAMRNNLQMQQRAMNDDIFQPQNLRYLSDYLQTLFPYGMGMSPQMRSQLLQKVPGMPQMDAGPQRPDLPPELMEIFSKLQPQQQQQ